MNRPPSITASYRHVKRISRRSRSNFYRSFWLLPRAKREAMCALYAFARITDDIGDCHEPAALRSQWLDWWRKTTAFYLISDSPADPVAMAPGVPEDTSDWPIDLNRRANEILPALRDTTVRFKVPTRYFLEIVDGVLADQQKTRFDTFEQLEHYCYLVASAVGLACLHIWEFKDPLPEEAAIDCGVAFQLTNILRDISEDARRGRIYLPRQHYAQHGLAEDDLLVPRADDRLTCLIDDEVRRAKALYVSGWRVYDSLSDDGQPVFSMMWRTYRALLDRIAENPRAVFSRRVQLSFSERADIVSRHLVPSIFGAFPVPPAEVTAASGARGE